MQPHFHIYFMKCIIFIIISIWIYNVHKFKIKINIWFKTKHPNIKIRIMFINPELDSKQNIQKLNRYNVQSPSLLAITSRVLALSRDGCAYLAPQTPPEAGLHWIFVVVVVYNVQSIQILKYIVKDSKLSTSEISSCIFILQQVK